MNEEFSKTLIFNSLKSREKGRRRKSNQSIVEKVHTSSSDDHLWT